MSGLLKKKNTIIYGAAGGIGREVARAFAREGATVFLAGRTRETLDAVAAEIDADGGTAHVAVVDALDDAAVWPAPSCPPPSPTSSVSTRSGS